MSKRDIQEQLINAAAPSLELMRAASDEISLLRTENMKFLGLLQGWRNAYLLWLASAPSANDALHEVDDKTLELLS